MKQNKNTTQIQNKYNTNTNISRHMNINTDMNMDMNFKNWFEVLFKIKEEDWDYNLGSLPVYNDIKNKFGIFETESIKELESKVKTLYANKENKCSEFGVNVKFEIRLNNGLTTDNINYFDVSSLQFNCNDKYNPVFQIASNFNCLELANEKINPLNGYFMTKLMSDGTQGPSAVASSPYGLLKKINIFMKHGIDLLSNIKELTYNNGKCYYNKNKHINFNNINYGDVKIGIHKNIYANIDRSNIHNLKFNKIGKKITQIYSSTCINHHNDNNDLSTLFLKSAYEGIFLYSILNNNKEIYLTLIGGCSFNNNIDLIFQSIYNAFDKYKHLLPKNCKVILPIYCHKNNKKVLHIFNNINYNSISEFVNIKYY
jgi:hypothetical protein